MKPDRTRILFWALAFILTAFYTFALAVGQEASPSAANPAESHGLSPIRRVTGKSETVKVPMVSEPWSATLGRVTEREHRERPDIGDFPGAREWKRQANARRKALMQAVSRDAVSSEDVMLSPVHVLLSPSLSFRDRDGGRGISLCLLMANCENYLWPLQPEISEGSGGLWGLMALPWGAPLLSSSQFQIPGQQFAGTGTDPGVVFDGPSETDTHEIPPDPQIAAGPNYVVVAVNALLAIYDKSGNLQGSFQNFSSFFSSLGITGQIFDPRIIYDQADQRFIFSAAEIDFTSLTNGHVFVAVSATDDPTGIWYKFALNSEGRNAAGTQDTFPDFPGLGLGPSAVYITTNQFALTQACLTTDTEYCYFSDAWIKVIGLAELLAGNPNLNITAFTKVQTATGFPAFAIQPALTYGPSNNEFLVAARFDNYTGTALDLFAIPTSGTPTLTTADLTVPQYSYPPDALQGGTLSAIITDDFRPLNAVWTSGSLYCAQNAAASSSSGVAARWYQIALSDLASASLAQSGDVMGSGDAYYPAISLKADGTLALAFTTSSEFFEMASAAFTGRAASDAPSTMRSYAIYRAGTGAYDDHVNRWGDYSGVSPDPDGSNFWMIAEYAGTPDPHFGTAVAEISTPPALSISPSSIDFGWVLEGSASNPQTVTLTNISSSSVAVGTAASSGANASDFSISNDGCSGQSLAANQSCTLSVTLKPSVQNFEYALLSVPYAGNEFVTMGLTGAGLVQAVITPSSPSLAFPPTLVGSASAPQAVTFTNKGNISTGTLFDLLFRGVHPDQQLPHDIGRQCELPDDSGIPCRREWDGERTCGTQ